MSVYSAIGLVGQGVIANVGVQREPGKPNALGEFEYHVEWSASDGFDGMRYVDGYVLHNPDDGLVALMLKAFAEIKDVQRP